MIEPEIVPKIPDPVAPDPPQESMLSDLVLNGVFGLINKFILDQSSRLNFGFPKDTRDVRNTLFKRSRARTVPANPTIEEVNNQLSDSIFYMTSYRHTATAKASVKNINELKRQLKILGELITVASTLNKEVQKLI